MSTKKDNKDWKHNPIWPIAYCIWPPILRRLEKLGIHKGRQNYHLGYIKKDCSIEDVKTFLKKQGFEPATLAWKDSDEVLSMRKPHNKQFQYHIRAYNDKEMRGHYEYSSEGNPFKHIFESHFTPEQEFFILLMKDFLNSKKL